MATIAPIRALWLQVGGEQCLVQTSCTTEAKQIPSLQRSRRLAMDLETTLSLQHQQNCHLLEMLDLAILARLPSLGV
jgi:hypothetical protein